MVKLTMSNLMDVMKLISNGDLDSKDVYVLDPNRLISSYGEKFIAAHRLSDTKVGKLWPDGNELTYLIRTAEDDNNNDIINDHEDDDDEFLDLI